MGADDDWTGDGFDKLDPRMMEAVAWFEAMRADGVAHADRVAFRAWLRRDPANEAAYAEVGRIWNGLRDLPEARRRRRKVTRRDLGKTALAGLAVGAGWLAYQQKPFADLRASKGERRREVLPDGSVVELASATALSLDFGSAERAVDMHYGEAFFSVASNPARPFVVRIGAGSVRAIGTAFQIAEGGGGVRVDVAEGVVELSHRDRRVELSAGSSASFEAGGLSAVVRADPTEAFAWRDGRLVFVSAPLERVVAELNRWRHGRIVLMSGGLARRPVTLIVDLDRVGDALDVLRTALPIRIVEATSYVALVFAR